MTVRLHTFVLFAALSALLVPSRASTQTIPDPSGHWEGSIVAPFGEIAIALDIARRDNQLVATFSRSDGSISDYPLSDIELTGGELKLALKANGGGVLRGTITGATLSGTFAAFAGTVPFAVKRTGDARLPAPVVNASISTTLEGTWTGRLAAGADSTTFRMTLANQANGTATARIADDHGVDVPLKVTQDGLRVTLEIPSAHATFAGTLNADATAIDGAYTEGSLSVPVTFTRPR